MDPADMDAAKKYRILELQAQILVQQSVSIQIYKSHLMGKTPREGWLAILD
jgi:hypothetical protein